MTTRREWGAAERRPARPEGGAAIETRNDTALRRLAEAAAAVVNMRAAVVVHRDRGRDEVVAAHGLPPGHWPLNGHWPPDTGQRDGHPTVVGDLGRHPATRCHPLVAATPPMRGYIGVSISDRDGTPLGTLSLFDSRAAVDPTDAQRRALDALARAVAEHLRAWPTTSHAHEPNAVTDAEAKFRSLVERTLVGAYILQDDRFVYVNQQFASLLGYRPEELLQLPDALTIVADADREHVDQRQRRRIAGHSGPARYRLRLRHADGHCVPVEVLTDSMVYGGKLAITGSVIDCTEQVNYEHTLVAREAKQAAVARLGERALSIDEPSQLYEEAVRSVANVLDIDYAEVLEWQPEHENFRLCAGVGWDEGTVGNTVIPGGYESQAGYTLERVGPVRVRDQREEDRFQATELLTAHGVLSGASVAIRGRKRPFGVLAAHSRQWRDYTDDDVNFLQTVANLLGEAVERYRSIEALHRNQQLLRHTNRLARVGGWELDVATAQLRHTEQALRIHEVDDDFRATAEQAVSFYAPEAQPQLRSAVARAIRNGESFDLTLPLITARGRRLCVRTVGEPEYDSGEVARVTGAIQDCTEQMRVEETLRRSKANLKAVLDNSPDAMMLIDRDYVIQAINAAAAQRTAMVFGGAFSIGDNILDCMGDSERAAMPRYDIAQALAGEPVKVVRNIKTEDERDYWAEISYTPVRDAAGEVISIAFSSRDVTAQKQRQQMEADRSRLLDQIARGRPLPETLAELARVSERPYPGVHAALWLLEGTELELATAPSLDEKLAGRLERADIDDHRSTIVRASNEAEAVVTPQLGEANDSGTLETAARAAGLRACWAFPILGQEAADVLGVFAFFADSPGSPDASQWHTLQQAVYLGSIAIEQARLTERLAYQAHHDSLTELPNRLLFLDRLEQALRHAERHDEAVAVMLLDIDDFKLINDSLGHSAGDRLLCVISERLSQCLRPDDTVARIGGDEFALVLPLRTSRDATPIAERILEAMRQPVALLSHHLKPSPSMGISVFPEDGNSVEVLLQNADTAMYTAKHAGKGRFHYFAETMNVRATQRLQLESELRRALDGDEFEVRFQPRIELASGRCLGGEGLLRWHHPQRGELAPGQFLDVAEQTGLIADIDTWVFRRACAQAASWAILGEPMLLSVNLSARELYTESLVESCAAAVEESGVDPALIELEITESTLMEDLTRAAEQLHKLRERMPGLRIAIDDFGTGYSSLNYLSRLPIDTLKIDQVFVHDLSPGPESDSARAIVRTIIELARHLRLTVLAEGVETERQARELQALGCDQAQGYFYAPALAADELARRFIARPGDAE